MWKALWVAAALALVGLVASQGGPEKRSKIPLKEEKNRRKTRRSTDCQFGKKRYELESVWNPDLGAPFGVMLCVKCECVPVKRKRRIKGKVKCRNIAPECPKPTCDNPVLLPGQCCKMCTGQKNEAFISDVSVKEDPDDLEKPPMRDYAVVMTTWGLEEKGLDRDRERVVGTARFHFQKRDLHFGLYYGARGPPPRALQFVDEEGQILEELDLQAAVDERNRRVCGVWRKPPKAYRRLLRKEKLKASLVPADNTTHWTAQGRLFRDQGLETEKYSSLLVPEGAKNKTGGGTAVVSVDSNTGSVHLLVLFQGLFPPQQPWNVSFVAVLRNHKDPDEVVLREEFFRPKPDPEMERVEVKTVLELPQLRQLARGHLVLDVFASDQPDYKLSGPIHTKPDCSVFAAVMTSPESPSAGTGFALLNLNADGSVDYRINLEGVPSSVVGLSMEGTQKRKTRVMDDILAAVYEGWANGTYSKASVRDLEMLWDEEVWIGVDLEGGARLQGQVQWELFSEAHLGSRPVFLRAALRSAGALAWMATDGDCNMHYDLRTGGLEASEKHPIMLELLESPIRQNAVGIPNRNTALGRFAQASGEGHELELSKITLARIDAGITELVLRQDLGMQEVVDVRTTISRGQVGIGGSCLPSYKVPAPVLHGSGILLDESGDPDAEGDDENEIPGTDRCFYDNLIHEDLEQWPSPNDNCLMCSCQKGKVLCDKEICPLIACNNPVILPGQCCPICYDGPGELDPTRGCYFQAGDKKFHVAGSTWHPYMPPRGFSKCAVCTCDARTLQVSCNRLKCPRLTCPRSLQYREPGSCCRECPDPVAVNRTGSRDRDRDPDEIQDQGSEKTDAEITAAILQDGGCLVRGEVFENGDQWHPKVIPFGELKCIDCSCKDKVYTCRRRHCPKVSCPKPVKDEGECCWRCPDDKPTSRLKFGR